MKIEYTTNTKSFLDLCSKLTYKDKDCIEVKLYTDNKLNTPYELYMSMDKRWMDYYVITDTIKNKIVCTIALDICGNLNYFVTNDLEPSNTKRFIKTIKQLADETIAKRKVVFVTTSNEYQEAIKFNRLIGMKCVKITEKTSKWYYSDTEGFE